MSDSDSSGTLSSAGGDDDGDGNGAPNAGARDTILGGKLQQHRRMSTVSSNFLWNEDGNLGLMDDNKSMDDSDEDGEELDAEQLLEQEHEKLQFFDNSLTQCHNLASKMTGVLQNLQDKLKKLQTTLDPIRKDTTEVATAEKNINKTMCELRKVMEYHQLTTEPLSEIKKKTLAASSGVHVQNGDNIDEWNDSDEWNDPFLIWIEKINEAKNYFQENRFKSSDLAIDNLRNIAEIALDRMESYFRDLLKQHTTRNKRVIDEITGYKLMDHWKDRNVAYPLWSNKLMVMMMNKKKHNRDRERSRHAVPHHININNDTTENDEQMVTNLLYIPYRVIKLLANVAVRIEQTANVHGLKDRLAELVIGPRSNLLYDILSSLNEENLLTIMYIHSYLQSAMKQKRANLFKEKLPVSAADTGTGTTEAETVEEEDEDMKQEHKEQMALSADALDKLNTINKFETAAQESNLMNDYNIAIDIKAVSHPIILLLHVALSLFQLERHLCCIILDVKNEVLLEFDEFFNCVIAEPLQFVIEKVENVLAVKDVMDVTRNAQVQSKNRAADRSRRLSFNQISNFGVNPNIPMHEAAKVTAKSTAKAAVINDSIHKNMIVVKLDLVHCWMRLYPAFDAVLNQSKDYGAECDRDGENNNERGGDMSDSTSLSAVDQSSKRGMLHLSRLGDQLYFNCYQSLEERIKMIREHKELKNVRVDGGYHPLTIETVKLMFGIYEYRDALQHLYDTQKSVSPMMKILVNSDSHYEKNANDPILQKRQIEKTLIAIVSALRDNLKQKSALYGNNKSSLEAIFMLNNLHYMVKTIGDTELEIASGQAVLVSLRNDIGKWKKKYEHATWHKVKEYINLSKLREDYFTDKANNLSTKEKRPIKQRYAGFNKEFQEQLNTQKYFSVPDSNLRTQLINRNIDIVLPMYRIFVGKFKNIQFTKDRGKYHKFDEKTLHDKMRQFFQQN